MAIRARSSTLSEDLARSPAVGKPQSPLNRRVSPPPLRVKEDHIYHPVEETSPSDGGIRLMKKVVINGFGRIGRQVLYNYLTDTPGNIEIVAVNDPNPTEEL